MDELGSGARVAIIGAGPGGLSAAKHALEAGFDVSVFEASDDLGGQWYTGAAHSGIWPGYAHQHQSCDDRLLRLPRAADARIAPAAEQIHDYLRSLRRGIRRESTAFGSTPGSSRCVLGGTWTASQFDAVVVASGRFHSPLLPPGLDGFSGEVLHAYDYPGADHFRDRHVLVYGNGVSGHEIASDIANVTRGALRISQTAVRVAEERRGRLVRLAVVHAHRRIATRGHGSRRLRKHDARPGLAGGREPG